MGPIGEVIATSSVSLTAVSFILHQPPALGSLVKVEVQEAQRTLYAVVSFGTTTGLDPGRRVLRRSTDEVRDAGIFAQHPQLEKVLRTEFQALLVGYRTEDGPLHQNVPPQPPPLHYTVSHCAPEEVRAMSEKRGYFRLLLASGGELAPEQLLAAHIRETYATRGDDRLWLDGAASDAAALLRADYDRLLGLLQAIEPAG
jgi:hypothetical protein